MHFLPRNGIRNLHMRMPYRPQLPQRIPRQLKQRLPIPPPRMLLLLRNIKHKQRQRRPIVLFRATPYVPDDAVVECGRVARTEGEAVADLEGEGHAGGLKGGAGDVAEDVHGGLVLDGSENLRRVLGRWV